MHLSYVAHDVERISVLAGSATPAQRLPAAAHAARMPEAEVVTKLVPVPPQRVVAIAPGVSVADVGEPGPAACGNAGQHVIDKFGIRYRGVVSSGSRNGVRKGPHRVETAASRRWRRRLEPAVGVRPARATGKNGSAARHRDVE